MSDNIEFHQASEFKPEPEEQPVFEGHGAVRDAAAALHEQRGEEAPARKVVMGEDAPKTLSLRQAAEGLTFSRKLDAAKKQVEDGTTVEDAVGIANAPPPEPIKLGDDDEDGPLSVSDAARALTVAREERRRALAEIVGEELAQQTLGEPEATERPEEAKPAEQPKPDPLAEERARLEREYKAAQRLRELSPAETLLTAELQQLTQHANTFADITTAEQLNALKTANPQRYEDFWKIFQATTEKTNQLKTASAEWQMLDAQRQAKLNEALAKERERFVEEQDALVENAAPELKDPEQKRAIAETARAMFADMGVDEKQLRALRSGEEKIDLRSAAAQRVILDAAKWRQAQAKAKEIQATPIPPVQRPGVARPPVNGAVKKVGELSALLDRGDLSTNQKIALGVQLMQAQREARG